MTILMKYCALEKIQLKYHPWRSSSTSNVEFLSFFVDQNGNFRWIILLNYFEPNIMIWSWRTNTEKSISFCFLHWLLTHRVSSHVLYQFFLSKFWNHSAFATWRAPPIATRPTLGQKFIRFLLNWPILLKILCEIR